MYLTKTYTSIVPEIKQQYKQPDAGIYFCNRTFHIQSGKQFP